MSGPLLSTFSLFYNHFRVIRVTEVEGNEISIYLFNEIVFSFAVFSLRNLIDFIEVASEKHQQGTEGKNTGYNLSSQLIRFDRLLKWSNFPSAKWLSPLVHPTHQRFYLPGHHLLKTKLG